MRVTRIYTSQELTPGQTLALEQTAAKHLVQVLRMRAGDEMVLFNGDGHEYPSRLETATKKGADAVVLSRSDREPDCLLDIHLCISISRGERMDFALQKAVELGVTEITPLFSERSVVNLKGERLDKRMQHWRQVMLSACEQSGRCRVPTLNRARRFEDILAEPLIGLGMVLSHRTDTCIHELNPESNKLTVLIGPEGGLSENEIASAEGHGFNRVKLGPRVMRTETAPLAAIAAAQTLWGDFR